MTTNQPDTGYEPADLSELTATDALLDRLGRRSAADADLLDPAAGALLELLAVVDETRSEPDTGLAHLVEVLDGRPLYLAEAGSSEALSADHMIDLGAGELDEKADTQAEPSRPRVIDLTEVEAEAEVDADADAEIEPVVALKPADPADPGDPDAGSELPADPESEDAVQPVEVPAARTLSGSPSTAPNVIPIQAGARRWERALSHVSLPAASVLLLLAVSGGVSAAVTGNPMTPVNQVSKVMAQLPGGGNPQRSLTNVKGEITAASNAVRKNDASAASRHLAAARRGLPDVPDDQKQQLRLMIANVETLLASPMAPSPVVPTPPIGVGATTPPITSTTTPSAQPTASPTAGVPTTSPSTDPEPTVEPTVPVEVPDSTPPADPTPVATASGS